MPGSTIGKRTIGCLDRGQCTAEGAGVGYPRGGAARDVEAPWGEVVGVGGWVTCARGGTGGEPRLRVLDGTRGCEAIWEPAVVWRGAKVIWDTGRSVWCCVVWRGGLLFPRQARACGKHGAGRRGGEHSPLLPAFHVTEVPIWDEGGARLTHHSW